VERRNSPSPVRFLRIPLDPPFPKGDFTRRQSPFFRRGTKGDAYRTPQNPPSSEGGCLPLKFSIPLYPPSPREFLRIPLDPPFDKGGFYTTAIPLLQKGDKGGCLPHTTNSPFFRRGIKGDDHHLKFNPPVSPFSKGDSGER